ncbi:MAG: sugar phosphate nucleotidyltransferase [Ketobacteraceae bacterium]|nr:sugar phosphate nucleotidyltransferase [Ketobacteraceae bacterium]
MADSHKDIKAILLAGGKGTRLRPLTAVFPKPMVPLGHMPIIEILLNKIKNSGLKNVTVSTGYLAELIMALCGDGSKYGLAIDYIREDEPLGTAGPIGLIDGLPENFIVMNGDLLTTLNFGKMIDFHIENDADITIATYKRDVRIDFGVVDRDNEVFKGFSEKPTFHYDVSMGFNILSRRVLKYIEKNQYLDMPDLILKVHEDGGKVRCYQEDCYWLDIGRMDDYAQAQLDFEENQQRFLGAE